MEYAGVDWLRETKTPWCSEWKPLGHVDIGSRRFLVIRVETGGPIPPHYGHVWETAGDVVALRRLRSMGANKMPVISLHRAAGSGGKLYLLSPCWSLEPEVNEWGEVGL